MICVRPAYLSSVCLYSPPWIDMRDVVLLVTTSTTKAGPLRSDDHGRLLNS